MRLGSVVMTVMVLCCLAVPTQAQVFAGPNLEWTYWSLGDQFDEESGSTMSVGGYLLSPGLRVGYVFPNRKIAAALDVGVQDERIGSIEYTNVVVEPSLTYAFLSERATSPYLSVSAGWHHLSLGDVTRPLVGGAVGVRHRISAGHGYVRAEVRFDHFAEEETEGLLLPEKMVGLRLGCDLLITR